MRPPCSLLAATDDGVRPGGNSVLSVYCRGPGTRWRMLSHFEACAAGSMTVCGRIAFSARGRPGTLDFGRIQIPDVQMLSDILPVTTTAFCIFRNSSPGTACCFCRTQCKAGCTVSGTSSAHPGREAASARCSAPSFLAALPDGLSFGADFDHHAGAGAIGSPYTLLLRLKWRLHACWRQAGDGRIHLACRRGLSLHLRRCTELVCCRSSCVR